MADIFISYSSRDRDRAQKLAEQLQDLGYSVWMDVSDIDPATRWSTEIAEAINLCTILALLLSKASVASENVVKELTLAAEKKKHILPIVIEKVELNPDFEYHLAGLQYTSIENLKAITRALEHLASQQHKEPRTESQQKQDPAVQKQDDRKRIAVLPFDDLSPARNNDWFSDGLTNELISKLSRLSQLFVIDRQTSREYKNTKFKTKQIASELDVQYLLTGDVRKSGDRIQVGVTLIDCGSAQTLWDGKYPGTMTDIFAIQDEVASKITESLNLVLTRKEKREVARRPTDNPEAYAMGLRAISYMNRNTKQDFLYGIQLCNEAIELDPSFVAAYDHLAHCCLNIYQMYDRNPEWLIKAEQAIDKAMKLKPSDPINHSTLAILHLRRGEGPKAVAAAKKAITLAPNNETSYFQLGYIYDGLNDYRSAAEAYERSLALNPLSLDTHANVCLDYHLLGDNEHLVRAAERALPYFQKYVASHPDDQNKRQRYASTLYYLGRKDECFTEIESLLKLPGLDGKTYYNSACRYAAEGMIDRAFELIGKALEVGFADYELIMTDPDLAPLRMIDRWLWLMSLMEQRPQKQTFKTAVTS